MSRGDLTFWVVQEETIVPLLLSPLQKQSRLHTQLDCAGWKGRTKCQQYCFSWLTSALLWHRILDIEHSSHQHAWKDRWGLLAKIKTVGRSRHGKVCYRKTTCGISSLPVQFIAIRFWCRNSSPQTTIKCFISKQWRNLHHLASGIFQMIWLLSCRRQQCNGGLYLQH